MNTNPNSLTPHILVVEDDPASRLLMRASLQKSGFRVSEAQDGLAAITDFEELEPDAVLLDVMMPKLDGYDTCRAIRKLKGGEHTPILMVTGLDDLEAIHKAFDSGATDFITKPINWAILNYRVKYMLRASEAFLDIVDKQHQIQELAFFDHLTGLANRTLFKDTLEVAIAENTISDSLVAVLFLDLDRFKAINDTLGHHMGDRLLKSVAGRINACIRENDTFSRRTKRNSRHYISRLGGDEFTVLLPQLKDPEDAARAAIRINKSLTEQFLIEGTEIFISASIGISIFPLDGNEAEELMKHADLAMYHAKEKGKNNFQFYKTSLNVKAKERLEFENDVRKAVQNNEFELYYQPQIDLASGMISGAEALSRWHHKTRGTVSPGEFIPVIEELGLIIPFTEWVIRQSGQQQVDWKNRNCRPPKIAINVSSQHFVEQNIPDKIVQTLQSFNISSDFLELELTESVLADQNDETILTLQRIKELGMTISVDDFGTGYSSLVYLKTFPIDIVKIDRFFVKDILTSVQDAAIVKAIIAMAHSMGIKVVAEGIEEPGQYRLLREMQCDYGQGYLFSHAISAADFGQMIKSNQSLIPEDGA